MDDKELMPTTLDITFAPAELSADFDTMRERLAQFMEPYRDMDDKALEGMSRKELSDQRAAINKLIKSVDDGRKAIKAEYNKPLKAFEAEVKALLEPACEAEAQLKRHIDRKDEIKREGYRERLHAYYMEVADALAGYVTFEQIYDPDWVKSEAKYKAAFDIISDKCSRLASDWAALRKMQDTLYDFNAAERMLFDTFDLRATLEADERSKQADEQRKAMKADLGMEEAYEPPVFEEVETEPFQDSADSSAPVVDDAPYRKHYVLHVWLSESEFDALTKWKNANCIGMKWGLLSDKLREGLFAVMNGKAEIVYKGAK